MRTTLLFIAFLVAANQARAVEPITYARAADIHQLRAITVAGPGTGIWRDSADGLIAPWPDSTHHRVEVNTFLRERRDELQSELRIPAEDLQRYWEQRKRKSAKSLLRVTW